MKPHAERARVLEIQEPALIVKINQRYQPGMSLQEVYACARRCWRMNIKHAQQVAYILVVAHGIVRGVFRPQAFHTFTPDMAAHAKEIGRVYFDAEIVSNSPYYGCSTHGLFKRGTASPVLYLNA